MKKWMLCDHSYSSRASVKNKKRRYAILSALVISSQMLVTGCQSDESIRELLTQTSADGTEALDESTGDPLVDASASNPEKIQNNITGYGYMGTMFQAEGITFCDQIISFADWENLTSEVICTDPTCIHEAYDRKTNPDPTCSAAYPGSYFSFQVASIIDGDKRLLFVDSSDNTYDDDGTEHTAYHTKVFSCDMDGSNRKSLTTFDGQWTDYKSSVIYENKLYFSSVKGYTSTIVDDYEDEYGIPGMLADSFNTNQLCSLDLDTWELKVYAEEDGDNGFQNLVFTDDALYFVFMTTDYEYILYRLDLEQDTCEELYRSDTTSFVLNGAIGHQLLIAVYNSETKRYDQYLYNEETGQKTMLAEGACAEASVVGNRFAIMTEDVRDTRNREDMDYVETYVFFDADGNELETVHYDQNFFFLFTLDDHVLYDFTAGADDEQKSGVYEVNLSELQNIREKGRYVYSGWV